MPNAISIASSGLKSQEFYIDKIANDLANLNTPNYKATKLTFEDVLYEHIDGASPLFEHQARPKIGLGTAIFKSEKDFSQGPLKATGNKYDIAIQGAGFLQVNGSDGNTLYTRDSSLKVDEEGYLCTHDGLRLSDEIQIPDDIVDIKIAKNGDVEAILPDDPEPQLLGSIKLAKFIDPSSLNPLGSGLYTPSESTSDPLIDAPGSSGMGELIQQQIEGSNVDMVGSLMQLTMAQRVYQLNAKAIEIADQLEKTINELRD